MNSYFSIVSHPVDEGVLKRSFSDLSCGAVVTFDGRVRNHHAGKEVSALSYEHHPLMAIPEGSLIVEEALARFPITQAIAVHRVGDVPLGEIAVLTMVSSPHRAEAFQACQFLIDEIKHRVPIWKYETYSDGTSLYTEQCEGCAARSQVHSCEDQSTSPK